MNAFNYIANTLFIKNINFHTNINVNNLSTFSPKTYIPYIFNISDSDTTHINFIISCFIFSDRSKFTAIQSHCIDSIFTRQIDTERFITFFCNIQKIYWSLKRFVRHIKLRKFKCKVENDLLLSPILPSQKNVFRFFENKCIYMFTLQDLSRIIISSICNSPLFHSEPIHPKNPYSGIEFSNADLYNIYFKMKEGLLIIPDVIHKFFLSNFDIPHFMNNNQVLIRNVYINQFVQNEDEDEIIEYIYDMLETYTQFSIDEDFPNNILIKTFINILPTYLRFKYSLDNSCRTQNSQKIREYMNNLQQKTPEFGRKIFSIINRKKYVSFITINGNTEKTLWGRPDTKYNVVDFDSSTESNILPNTRISIPDIHIDNSFNILNSPFAMDAGFRDQLIYNMNSDYTVITNNQPLDFTSDIESNYDSYDDMEVDESMYDP